MGKLNEIKCPNCGSSLNVDADKLNGFIKCEYCGSSFEYEPSKQLSDVEIERLKAEQARLASENFDKILNRQNEMLNSPQAKLFKIIFLVIFITAFVFILFNMIKIMGRF